MYVSGSSGESKLEFGLKEAYIGFRFVIKV